MGVLDNVFAGSNGLYRTLAETLGGTAVVTYVNSSVYDEVTDSVTETTEEVTVPFLCESHTSLNKTSYPASNGGILISGGLLYDANDLAGTIPLASLPQIPQAGRERITFNGEVYTISQIKILAVGNSNIAVAIVGKK